MRNWQVPAYRLIEFAPRASRHCIGVPVINEGQKLIAQLDHMARLHFPADVIIADGGSSDGSTSEAILRGCRVRALLVKTGPGRLSAQMRMLFAYAIEQGYQGIVTLDGNGKDGVEAIPDFLAALDQGFDFVQGSRFLPGGAEINTPLDRKLAARFIHAPVISLAARFRYTDTTNGFRAFSTRLLLDPALQPFRDVFDTYNLHYYISVRAPRLGYAVKELPVSRAYPAAGPTPSKIAGLRGKFSLLYFLLRAAAGCYNPK